MQTNLHLVNGGSRIEYNTKETAQFIRLALKAAFPGQKFSVTTKYGSMYSATEIRWTDGPTAPEVEHITNRFTSKSFDGSTDSTNYHEQIVDGQRVSYSGWINVTRYTSPELLTLALQKFQVLRASDGLPPVNVTVQANGSHPFVAGPDANAPAGVCPSGFTFRFLYVSDAVQSIAHQLRSNGCIVRMK